MEIKINNSYLVRFDDGYSVFTIKEEKNCHYQIIWENVPPKKGENQEK